MDEQTINWVVVERLVRRAFCGMPLSSEEQAVINHAYSSNPEEYIRFSNVVRNEERDKLRLG